MVDGDYGENIIGKSIEKKESSNTFTKLIPLGIILILGFLFGTIIGMTFLGGSFDSSTMAKMTLAGTECALRNTADVGWIPSMVTELDKNNNLVGFPVCVPFDKNTGKMLKKV